MGPGQSQSKLSKAWCSVFERSIGVFDDDLAVTIEDDESDSAEQRFVTLGMGMNGRLLVVVYTYRGDDIRLISARPAEPHERKEYEVQL